MVVGGVEVDCVVKVGGVELVEKIGLNELIEGDINVGVGVGFDVVGVGDGGG